MNYKLKEHWEKLFKKTNNRKDIPLYTSTNQPIIIGCTYRTTWQDKHEMVFILAGFRGEKARLITRTTDKAFWTNEKDIIFSPTEKNIQKAKRLRDCSLIKFPTTKKQKYNVRQKDKI